MTALSVDPRERASKALSTVLQRLQSAGTQGALAVAMGVSDSTVSRTKNDKLEEAVVLLYFAGFKVVPQDMRCYPAEYVEALHVLARTHMVEQSEPLSWE